MITTTEQHHNPNYSNTNYPLIPTYLNPNKHLRHLSSATTKLYYLFPWHARALQK